MRETERRRTFEVVDALSIQDTDANVHTGLATTQEVDYIPDVLRRLGLLLHDELAVSVHCQR